MSNAKRTFRLALVAAALLAAMAAPGVAQSAAVGQMSVGAAAIEWLPQGNHARVVLTVSGPDGKVTRQEFEPGQAVAFSLFDDQGQRRADGVYNYEIRTAPQVAPRVQERIAAARAAGDEKALADLAARLPKGRVQSGAFSIASGSFVATDEAEPGGGAKAGGTRPVTQRAITNVTAADQVIADDLIVQQSLCVGFDCVNGESFGFDTIRLKENNTRIKFEDTSTGTFPTTDWQLTANDSASGGQSKFSIEDITGARVPFTVEAGSTTNSLYVDSTGRIGFRTSTPVLDLHINTSNTPGIRLEQNNSGGFTAQTWDIAGNEANFFVRDVTSGSLLPFRIRPGAPTSSIDISADGDVGIGTASPDEELHVEASDDDNSTALVQNTNASGLSAAAVVRAQADVANASFVSHGSGRTLSRFGQTLGGWSEFINTAGNGLIVGTVGNTSLILGTNSLARMTISGAGAITVPGNFTVTGTKNFAMVDPADSRRAIYYAALEGPEAGTYFRGTAKTTGGEVVIDLPGYFSRVTELERMTVQLTPVGSWGQIFVAEKSPSRLVIRTAPGAGDQEFDYLVQGVRKGYLDYQVERPNDLPLQQ